MKLTFAIIILFCSAHFPLNKTRVIQYRGDNYTTTFDVPLQFIGEYSGRKSGFLKLNADGTGVYKYDVFGIAPTSCERTEITFEWGMLTDKNGDLIKKKRDYGHSYPVLLKSTSSTSFQGCQTQVMMDYIMEKNNQLHISSSDDWKKVR